MFWCNPAVAGGPDEFMQLNWWAKFPLTIQENHRWVGSPCSNYPAILLIYYICIELIFYPRTSICLDCIEMNFATVRLKLEILMKMSFYILFNLFYKRKPDFN